MVRTIGNMGKCVRRWGVHFLTKRQAKRDARLGLNSEDIIVAKYLPPRPEWDPIHNPEHSVMQELLNTERIDLTTIQVEETEDALTKHWPVWLIILGLTLAAITEVEGAMMIFTDVGLTGRIRLIMGMMLAALIFFLTWAAGHVTTHTQETEEL